MWDVIVVGGGHNGLAAAAYLARQGLSVKVCEARHVIGGAAVTEEFHPGFRNSVCSYLVGMLSPRVVAELELVKFGLQVVPRPAEGFYPQPDGRHLLYTTDHADFARQLEAFHKGDGAGFERYDREVNEVAAIVQLLMERTPPNLDARIGDLVSAAGLAMKARKLSGRARAILARMMTSSVADFLDGYFAGDAVKGAFGYLAAVGNLQSPRAGGSAYVLLHHSFGELNGNQGAWGHAIGGMGAVSGAIAKSAMASDAEIEVSAPVAKIKTRDGRAAGVVLADGREFDAKTVVANLNPKLLYGNLVDPGLLPDDLKTDIGNYRCKSGTFRMNVALAELPDFTALPGKAQARHHGSSIIISPSIDYLERAYLDAKDGAWAKKPMIEMWISSTVDKTLAPEGKHVASLFAQHFHPNLSGKRSWDRHREKVADLIIRTMGEYAPNFPGSIIARQILSPLDLERQFHLVGGDIFHGAMHLDQIFSMRPVPGFADYRTPVPGLYLCGAGAHPGGGVTGLPGRGAARELLRDLSSIWPRKQQRGSRRPPPGGAGK
ncbi:MAG: NAD(P)/FAD-dependent oxidoreductase [Parvibaculum sp.]|nr:NAD(P)/FAD-dependent oxidoreductase [Parvibaculum sp.]